MKIEIEIDPIEAVLVGLVIQAGKSSNTFFSDFLTEKGKNFLEEVAQQIIAQGKKELFEQ